MRNNLYWAGFSILVFSVTLAACGGKTASACQL